MTEENTKKTNFEDTVRAVADDVTDLLDGAVDRTSKWIGGENGNKVVGGAAVGVLAAIVLPISLVGGALLGAGYAAIRQRSK
jgi:hypothetical protein